MKLSRIKDFEASSRRCFSQNDIIHFQVYIAQERVGQVVDILVDQTGNFQYLLVQLNQEIGSKRILIPYSESQVDPLRQCIDVSRINKAQIANMAYEQTDNNTIKCDFDEESCLYPL